MSIPVAIDDLAAAIEQYGWAYLLTVRDDLRAHIVAVTPAWDGDASGDGGRAEERLATRLRDPRSHCATRRSDRGGYSLIVDGDALRSRATSTVRFAPTGAVLHRPAPAGFTGSATGCGNDCAPVGPTGG